MTTSRRARRDGSAEKTLVRGSAIVIGLAASSLALPLPATAADRDHRCAKGSDSRLIEIRFADPSGTLPCKVVYRPESESDTLGTVSWQDINDPAACEAQADEVIQRLTEEGWQCTLEPASEQLTALAALDALTAATIEDAGDEDAAADEDAVEELAVVTEGVADLAPVDPVPAEPEPIDGPARFIDNPAVAAPSDDLVALITADLEQLDTKLDGFLEARIAGYGDLNEDDIEDVLVLYAYRSPQPAHRQFLAAYVHDGEAYQLTATHAVGGHVSATTDAEVEAIDQGVIHLTLQAFEPGDASCCPSGTRHIALALRDLDLVEIDADAPTR